jgi:hypothetical protein
MVEQRCFFHVVLSVYQDFVIWVGRQSGRVELDAAKPKQTDGWVESVLCAQLTDLWAQVRMTSKSRDMKPVRKRRKSSND